MFLRSRVNTRPEQRITEVASYMVTHVTFFQNALTEIWRMHLMQNALNAKRREFI